MRLAGAESVKIIQQCLGKMRPGPVKAGPQVLATDPGREKADGGADPSLAV
jgi:hypothetical protein